MSDVTKYMLIAFLALLALATGAYIDCRIMGGDPADCRVIFRGTGEFILKQTGH